MQIHIIPVTQSEVEKRVLKILKIFSEGFHLAGQRCMALLHSPKKYICNFLNRICI